MAFSSVFSTMKKEGLVKKIDQFLLLENSKEEDNDRKNVTNSPSSALGCSRANFYQRSGTPKEPIDARVRRIFDNGHGMHDRIQGYLTKMGDLMMDEVPLVNVPFEIQGHTDGILKENSKATKVSILELKSINSRGFSALKEAKEEHRAQAQVYMFCSEESRLELQEKYPTFIDFKQSKLSRVKKYRAMYGHLKEGKHYSRAEKIKFKVDQHLKMDDILFNVTSPINKAVVLYECKDTQELKEFIIGMDEALMQEVLDKFEYSNESWHKGKIPVRECTAKSQGRFCNFVNTCFE